MSDSNPDPKGQGGAPDDAAASAQPPPSQPPSADKPAEAAGEGKAPETDALAQARAEASSLKDKYLRTAADFDNFRKRTRRDIEDAERKGKENLLRDLLPVFDNLERAVVHASQATEAKAVADGVRMVLKQFTDTLERVGIKRVATIGSPFDPNVHEAIQQLESKDHPPGTVIAEVQAGYQIGEKLVRAAMVVVAKAPTN